MARLIGRSNSIATELQLVEVSRQSAHDVGTSPLQGSAWSRGHASLQGSRCQCSQADPRSAADVLYSRTLDQCTDLPERDPASCHWTPCYVTRTLHKNSPASIQMPRRQGDQAR